jgi:hypothetical protein
MRTPFGPVTRAPDQMGSDSKRSETRRKPRKQSDDQSIGRDSGFALARPMLDRVDYAL